MRNPKPLLRRLRSGIRTAIEAEEGGYVSLALVPEDAKHLAEWLDQYLDAGKPGRPAGTVSSSTTFDPWKQRQIEYLIGLHRSWKEIAEKVNWEKKKSVESLKKTYPRQKVAEQQQRQSAAERNERAVVRAVGHHLGRLPPRPPRLLRDKKP